MAGLGLGTVLCYHSTSNQHQAEHHHHPFPRNLPPLLLPPPHLPLQEAERTAEDAYRMSADLRLPPPKETACALVQGYVLLDELEPALIAFRRFLRAGGRPHARLGDAVIKLCLRHAQLGVAVKAARAMQLTGCPKTQMDKYKRLFAAYSEESRQALLARGSGGGGGGKGWERLR